MLVAKRAAAAPPSVVTVYKDAGCECCAKWVKHLNANGFVVTVRDVAEHGRDQAHDERAGDAPVLPHRCGGSSYVIEGHVPADVSRNSWLKSRRLWGSRCRECPWDRREWKAIASITTTSSRSIATARRRVYEKR